LNNWGGKSDASGIHQEFQSEFRLEFLSEKQLTSLKVEKTLNGSLILTLSPSVKIQVSLRCEGKTLLGDINELFVFKSLLTTPSNVLLLHLKQTFPPII